MLNCTFVTGMRLSFHLSNCPYLSTFVSVSVRNVTFEVFIRQDMTEVHNTSLVCLFLLTCCQSAYELIICPLMTLLKNLSCGKLETPVLCLVSCGHRLTDVLTRANKRLQSTVQSAVTMRMVSRMSAACSARQGGICCHSLWATDETEWVTNGPISLLFV